MLSRLQCDFANAKIGNSDLALRGAILWCVLAAVLSPLVDHTLTPEEPTLYLKFLDIDNVDQRIHNTSDLPIQCSSILQTDVVPNVSVAHTCLSWCRQSLGPGSGVTYAFSPVHYILISRHKTFQFNILKTCWKVETASWTLTWMPHVWLMYFYSLAYGSISAFTLLYLIYFNHYPKELGYHKFLQDASESSGETSVESSEVVGASWNLHSGCSTCLESNALEGAGERGDRSLYLGVLGTLVEPSLDLLSVLTFLRNGQPFFALWVILGLLFSFALSGDPFQLKGARAAAESFQRGLQSKTLLTHKMEEVPESLFSTTVQIYALLTLAVRAVRFFAALNLVGGALFSLFVSIPSQREAAWILLRSEVPDVEDTQEVQRVKEMRPWQSRLHERTLPCALAFWVYVATVVCGNMSRSREELQQWGTLWTVVRPMWGEWHWIPALLILSFRALVVVGILCQVFCVWPWMLRRWFAVF